MQSREKLKAEYDIFSAIVRLGHVSALFDWERWCYGAGIFCNSATKVLESTGENATFIHSPGNIQTVWVISETEDETSYVAYDMDGGFGNTTLFPFEVSLYRVNFLALAKWISKKLCIKDIQKPRARGTNKAPHLIYQIAKQKANIYVTYATTTSQLAECLSVIGKDEPALLLTLTDWVDDTVSAQELLADYEIDVYAIQTFIRPVFEQKTGNFIGYEYLLDEDFDTIVRDRKKLPPKASYLKRPDTCGWQDLHIRIAPMSHTEYSYASSDWIFAYYERGGKRLTKVWGSQIFKLSEFCQGKRCNKYYGMLKRLAATQGIEDTTSCDDAEKNRRNGYRKELRERLCQMFGYLSAESPIVQLDDNNEIFSALFSIAFTNPNSDPFDNANRLVPLKNSMQ